MKVFTLLLSCLFFQAVLAQNQIGADIDGTASFDLSGASVAMSSDGSRVAIGAPWNNGSTSNTGQVRVFELINGNWSQLGSDIYGSTSNDEAGRSVSLSADGNTLAIGIPYSDATAAFSGQARVYEYNGNAWIQKGGDLNAEGSGDYYGGSVSLSNNGNRIVVGAPYNSDVSYRRGHARVFEFIGGSWSQLGNDIDGEATNDWSGESVAISGNGNRVIIGARFNGGAGGAAGHVRVFELAGSNWNQVGSDIEAQGPGNYTGSSVDISFDGTKIVVGEKANSDNGIEAGQVRAFNWNGSNWIQRGQDILGSAADDNFGHAVSISDDGNFIASSSPFHDAAGTDGGKAEVYELSGGSWTKLGADILGEAANDLSGWSIELSGDGMTLAIGARDNSGANGSNSGHCRVYSIPASTSCPSALTISDKVYTENTTIQASTSIVLTNVQIATPFELTIEAPEVMINPTFETIQNGKLIIHSINGCN